MRTPPVHWPLVQSASSTQIPASAHVLLRPSSLADCQMLFSKFTSWSSQPAGGGSPCQPSLTWDQPPSWP